MDEKGGKKKLNSNRKWERMNLDDRDLGKRSELIIHEESNRLGLQ